MGIDLSPEQMPQTRLDATRTARSEQSVELFAHEGEYLGDRTLLEQAIHEITNIPTAALRGTPLSHVQQR